MNLKIGLVAGSLFGAMLGALTASPATAAMPVAPALAVPQASSVEQVRMICDAWGRCWWRPNYYGYYGPRPYYGPRYYGYGPRYYGYGPRYYGPRYHGYRGW